MTERALDAALELTMINQRTTSDVPKPDVWTKLHLNRCGNGHINSMDERSKI